MSGRLVSQGEVWVLNLIKAEDMHVRLYQNDVEGSLTEAQLEALDEGDFTEADFTGYASDAVTSSDGTVTEGTSGNPSDLTYSTSTFTSSDGTPQTIYGYYMTEDTGGTLVHYEQFSGGPYSVQNTDDVQFPAKITLD